MKRIFCFLIATVLCLCIFGCEKSAPSETQQSTKLPLETLLPLADDEKEVVLLSEKEYVEGTVGKIMAPNVLVVSIRSKPHVEKWGNTVYVILPEQSGEWCVGEYVQVEFATVERPVDSSKYVRIIADKINYFNNTTCAKPIIYFYPEVDTICSAKVTLNGRLTCTYPTHNSEGWQNFVARPDGTLVFPDGKQYYALYWEGEQATQWDLSKGFCVRGEDTAEFLEWALAAQGLSAREANEFIVYWLPLMQDNTYNVISFQTEAYTDGAKLDITPAPDSVLRVFMAYYATEQAVEIEPQQFEGFEREGFTVVEWGGSRVEK